MQEPGGKQERGESWSQAELIQLKAAVDRHGRDWAAVSRNIGSKTRKQCFQKIRAEVAAGRMQEPGGKHESWSQAELIQLKAAVDRHGRDWFAVSRDVGIKTRQQCMVKVTFEVAAGRMEEPGGKQESWSQAELIQLKAAVDRHGRDWAAVSRDVGSKTNKQCLNKVKSEVAAGRMQGPGGKQDRESWSQAELIQLKAAVDRHGRDWVAISRDVGSKTNKQCKSKVVAEVAAGRM
jgi:predicted SprT family Zn-dependent metalloprotease